MKNNLQNTAAFEGVLTPKSLTYPKSTDWLSLQPGDFTIFKATIDDIDNSAKLPFEITGDWPPPYRDITFKGKVPSLLPGVQYKFKAKLVADPKWGNQFNLVTLDRIKELNDAGETELFMSVLFGDSVFTKLKEGLDDELLEVFKDTQGRIKRLIKIKGIGNATANKICALYDLNVPYYKDYTVLHSKYGLTMLAINKLKEKFGSTEAVINVLEINPYTLMLVDGYGWAKCDKLALSNGYNPLGEFRVGAFIKYYLEEQAETEGHSWILLDDLLAAIKKEIGDVNLKLLQMWLRTWTNKDNSPNVRPWLYYEKETRRIGLSALRHLEFNIANEMYRLQTAKSFYDFSDADIEWAIADSEREQGWEYTSEQRKAIVGCLTNGVTIVTGSGGCVDKDTEFFNGERWKPISEYDENDVVLQYNVGGTANLVKPLAYIKASCDHLWLTQTKYGIDMCLSDEHRVIYQTSKGNLYEKPMIELKKKHEDSATGFRGKFYTTFNYNGDGIELTDEQIKIMCAVICDGSFIKGTENKKCRFHIKKERKKERLREIFAEAQIEWQEHKSAAEGYTDFYIEAPLKTKIFDAYWYQCNNHQLQIICDNILFWGGSISKGRKRFSSNVKENADFVQFAFAACGERATISQKNRVGQEYYTCNKRYIRRTVEYNVSITERIMVSIGGFHADEDKPQIKKYPSLDGYKYCFTLPSGMWVMRRNGKILVTGNSGKTSIMLPVTKLLRRKGILFSQCSLAGKAASNLSEITHEQGSTIHRLLGYDPVTGCFIKNAQRPLSENVIILDELSMVGAELFYDLIKAIPNGSKLITLGDPNQLEAIGMCNLLKDCVDSYAIPCYHLTKIHRQAQRSAIITDSLKIAEGKQIIGNFPVEETRGELKDFKVVTYADSENSQEVFMREYMQLLNQKIEPKDIMGVVPMRTRGDLSCLSLNKEIQAIVNRDEEKRSLFIKRPDCSYVLRVGDKVVNRKNRYDVKPYTPELPDDCYDGDEVPPIEIFNGNTGYVIEILKGGIVVDFIQQGPVYIKNEYAETVELGYVLTAHSAQGSQAPYVVVGIDMSAYALLCKEWLYTAITRARKYCILCGQITAVRKSTQISRVKRKQTWLKEALRQKFSI